MVSINGNYCYINNRIVVNASGIREYLKYKFLRHTRVALGINLLSISRIDPAVVDKIQKDAVRFTATKVGSEMVSAVAEMIFRTGSGRDQYLRELVKEMKVVASGGMKF